MSEHDDEPVYRCHVVAATTDALREFIDEVRPDTGCRPVARKTADGGVGIDVYLHESRLAQARSAKSAAAVDITPVENTTENWQARTREVGQGNRFATRGDHPHGLGRKE